MPRYALTPVLDRWAGILATLADYVRGLAGWRRAVTGLLAGGLSVLAMPPFFAWPVLLITLPVLLWLIEGASAKAESRPEAERPGWRRWLRVAFVAWCFGYGFHVFGLYWLREAFLVTGGRMALLWPLGVLGLPAYLALYHALAGVIAVALSRPGPGRAAALAVGLSTSEWLRGHLLTGFPWNAIGMALTFPLSLMQSAALVGLFGLSLIAVLVLAAPGYILALSPAAVGSARRRAVLALGLPLAGLVSMLTFGTLRLSAPPPPPLEGVRVRLVQPSIDQREKWLAAKQPEFVARHLALSLQNARGEPDGLAGITHVVWPEAAMPFLPLQRPEVLRAIDEALPDHVHLLAGILRLERSGVPVTGEERYARDGDRIYNSLAVFNGEGKPIGVYDKTHLVPFGEYLPFQSLLEGIGLSSLTRQRGGFALGLDPRPLLATPGLAGIGPLICYEAVFPGITAKSAGRPQVMINVTNDGWFGNSTGPRQHLHQSRLRSVEEGIPLMRVANNGITAVYDAYGRELARLDLDVAGVIDTEVPGRLARPLYAVLGDLIFGAMTLLTVVILKGGRISFTKPKVDNTPTWRKLLT